MTICLIIKILSTFGVLVGFGFGIYQWYIANKIKRAELIHQIIEKLRLDPEMLETMNMIDYDEQWYGKEFHRNSDKEKRIDKLFYYFTHVCYLRDREIINKEDFYIFEYSINRIYRSKQAKTYLWNIYHFSKEHHAKSSFHYLIEYLLNNIFKEHEKDKFNSNDPEKSGYEKYL